MSMHRHKALSFWYKPVWTPILEVNQNEPECFLFNTKSTLRVTANSNDPSWVKPFYEDKKNMLSHYNYLLSLRSSQ